jgi:hypothetical protein
MVRARPWPDWWEWEIDPQVGRGIWLDGAFAPSGSFSLPRLLLAPVFFMEPVRAPIILSPVTTSLYARRARSLFLIAMRPLSWVS